MTLYIGVTAQLYRDTVLAILTAILKIYHW